MPELPDVELYLHALGPRIVGRRLDAVRVASPFLVRSVEPPLDAARGLEVRGLRRLGKRIVWAMERDLFLVIHLMIAGRFRWASRVASVSASSLVPSALGLLPSALPRIPPKIGLAAFDFPNGSVLLTEAGTSRRASLHLVRGEAALAAMDPGGLEVLPSTVDAFAAAVRRENHTLKRTLTDPHLLSGIGNAYSDEILHLARLSPMQLTSRLSDEEVARLWRAAIETLEGWRSRLVAETGDAFPLKVTAFREGMRAHGRHGQPCPECGTPIQRIRYAANEANYCPTCQTGGKLLADRALSRLLRDDWPRSLDELELYKAARRM